MNAGLFGSLVPRLMRPHLESGPSISLSIDLSLPLLRFSICDFVNPPGSPAAEKALARPLHICQFLPIARPLYCRRMITSSQQASFKTDQGEFHTTFSYYFRSTLQRKERERYYSYRIHCANWSTSIIMRFWRGTLRAVGRLGRTP